MLSARPPLFTYTTEKLSATAFTERRDSSGGEYCCPQGEYGDFSSPLSFSLPHGGIIHSFLRYVKDIIDMKDIINWHDEEM